VGCRFLNRQLVHYVLKVSLVIALISVLGLTNDPPVVGAPDVPCGKAGCDATLTSQGRDSTNSESAGAALVVTAPAEAAAEDLVPDPCPWMIVEDLGEKSSWWGGNDPAVGHIELNKCVLGEVGAPLGGTLQIRYVPNTEPLPIPPPPDPAVLAEQATQRLEIPDPIIGVGPDRTEMAVQLWNWLWVDAPTPDPVTVTLQGVSVTVTATLTSTTWSMGEPATSGREYAPGPTATVTCQGAGTPIPANYDWKAEPPCGYKYAWRSLKERTGGTGKWPVTATTNWAVNWTSNTGAAGADALTATTTDQFDVGEYRIVLVEGG